MAPPNNPPAEPTAPPKRESSPVLIPTVGLGKDQVLEFINTYPKIPKLIYRKIYRIV